MVKIPILLFSIAILLMLLFTLFGCVRNTEPPPNICVTTKIVFVDTVPLNRIATTAELGKNIYYIDSCSNNNFMVKGHLFKKRLTKKHKPAHKHAVYLQYDDTTLTWCCAVDTTLTVDSVVELLLLKDTLKNK